MGRTRRRRRRKLRAGPGSRCYRLGKGGDDDEGFTSLVVWMSECGWEPSCNAVPAVFPMTGRGLLAKQKIDPGEVIVKIPGKLLITVKTVSDSKIGYLFNSGKSFTAQQVISLFLVWQKHEGERGFWHNYISSLPAFVCSPVHLTDDEILLLPKFVQEPVVKLKTNVCELYKDFLQSLDGTDVCSFCGTAFHDIFKFNDFVWAWSIVNSRAVYISPDQNSDHSVNISDVNSLAMAPYLDMFNHSNRAKVKAFMDTNDGSYQIRTLIPFAKNEQVFINYGSHSNLKLFVEYGFVLPDNHNDAITVSYKDLYDTVMTCLISDNNNKVIGPELSGAADLKYRFLKNHDLLSNLYLYADGLSWNVKVVTYILMSIDVHPKTMQIKVFSNAFDEVEMKFISRVGLNLAEAKLSEFGQILESLKEFVQAIKPASDCFKMAVNLFKEYIRVLNSCRDNLSDCV